jgi:hypothetical protein
VQREWGVVGVIARLSHVLGWTANLNTVGLLIGGAVSLYATPPNERWWIALGFAIGELAVFVTGEAVRYVLAGPRSLLIYRFESFLLSREWHHALRCAGPAATDSTWAQQNGRKS